MYRYLTILSACFILQNNTFAQEISLFGQYSGRVDYTAIGNTLNQFENNILTTFCETLPSSQADLNVSPTSNVVAAYLYWAGSGTGDVEVTLNSLSIVADDTYNVEYNDPFNGPLTYFSCYKDITDIVLDLGNTTYELSDLDISETLNTIPGYCNNRTNFAGWSIYVIYEDSSLPINQISLFQGLEIINREVQEKTIILENINVLDDEGAKIGFLAWEGDRNLNFGETLVINGNIISNPPLNPADNAFNGTNSFTNSETFYNGDLDVYNIQDNIAIGDTSVEIMLTTGDTDLNGVFRADLIMVNNIITVLNSQLPDATIVIDDYFLECNTRTVDIDFTVFNVNSTEILPADTPIAFYANDVFIGESSTQNIIIVDAFENGSVSLTIPNNIPDDFILMAVVDDDGEGNSTVIELNETNNNVLENVSLLPLPEFFVLQPLLACDISFNTAYFDLTTQLEFIAFEDIEDIAFFESLDDLHANDGNILALENYLSATTPQTIYIRKENDICYDIYSFVLTVENCPPWVPQGFSPNDDGYNDWFNIQGLYDIFEKHELLIYNRYGTLIFQGNNTKRWEGKANRGLNYKHVILPVGTYFYVLKLNDPNYKILTGWVYLNK